MFCRGMISPLWMIVQDGVPDLRSEPSCALDLADFTIWMARVEDGDLALPDRRRNILEKKIHKIRLNFRESLIGADIQVPALNNRESKARSKATETENVGMSIFSGSALRDSTYTVQQVRGADAEKWMHLCKILIQSYRLFNGIAVDCYEKQC